MSRLAVIDLGTVTCRLAIADVEDGRVVRMAKQSNIVNLGEGVDESGELCDAAIRRVVECVRAYAIAAREADAEALVCTLTSAARDARNSDVLLSEFKRLGLVPEVIPGSVEGTLTFLGVAQDFPGERILVADNGGGSTELAVGSLDGTGLNLEWVHSYDIGCRRVTERFLSHDGPATSTSLDAAHDFAHQVFKDAVCEGHILLNRMLPSRLVVCGGTSTSLVAMSLELVPYDPSRVHLARISRSEVARLEKLLAARTLLERAAVPGLQPQRAAVILGGVTIVLELMDTCGFDEMTVSESDLLFGLALTAAAALEGAKSPVDWIPRLAFPMSD